MLDAIVDLPFALPTAVAGIALTAIFAQNGWIGQFLEPLGIKIAYTWTGIVIALTFIGLPFVVRTLQPVIEEIDREVEEAAATLGATRRQTMTRVIFPTLLPALLTGFVLALARAVGEYGSVIFIAGNMPYQTEIAPLLIVIRLDRVRLPRRHRHRDVDAGDFVCAVPHDQSDPGLGAQETGRCLTSHCRHRRSQRRRPRAARRRRPRRVRSRAS